jgi:hypothetical protein
MLRQIISKLGALHEASKRTNFIAARSAANGSTRAKSLAFRVFSEAVDKSCKVLMGKNGSPKDLHPERTAALVQLEAPFQLSWTLNCLVYATFGIHCAICLILCTRSWRPSMDAELRHASPSLLANATAISGPPTPSLRESNRNSLRSAVNGLKDVAKVKQLSQKAGSNGTRKAIPQHDGAKEICDLIDNLVMMLAFVLAVYVKIVLALKPALSEMGSSNFLSLFLTGNLILIAFEAFIWYLSMLAQSKELETILLWNILADARRTNQAHTKTRLPEHHNPKPSNKATNVPYDAEKSGAPDNDYNDECVGVENHPVTEEDTDSENHSDYEDDSDDDEGSDDSGIQELWDGQYSSWENISLTN